MRANGRNERIRDSLAQMVNGTCLSSKISGVTEEILLNISLVHALHAYLKDVHAVATAAHSRILPC